MIIFVVYVESGENTNSFPVKAYRTENNAIEHVKQINKQKKYKGYIENADVKPLSGNELTVMSVNHQQRKALVAVSENKPEIERFIHNYKYKSQQYVSIEKITVE